ncbi:MAG: YciI family protein [Hyphomicrobiales bacterium]|nr:MAG: YciI family protein [Hyphomicrobiales bacterium]
MKFIFLIYLDEARFEVMDQRERDSYVNAMLDYDEELRAGGSYVTSEPLKAPASAVTVRNWQDELSATDGPFAETKEHLSGFCIVDVDSLAEAIRLAGRMPLARVGSIEVRPLDQLERTAS